MTISKTQEKGYTVYYKAASKDLKSLMDLYINKKISGKPLSSGNVLRSVELVEYNSQKFIIKNDREIDPRFEKNCKILSPGPSIPGSSEYWMNLHRKIVPVQQTSIMSLRKHVFVSAMMFIPFMNTLKVFP